MSGKIYQWQETRINNITYSGKSLTVHTTLLISLETVKLSINCLEQWSLACTSFHVRVLMFMSPLRILLNMLPHILEVISLLCLNTEEHRSLEG